MQPTYLPIANIFGQQVRYTVPLFQRPYVWTETEQWQPLWDDIATVAKRVLETLDGKVRGHFLGSAVLEVAWTQTGSLQRREVIDGQQRLTTLQLLLKAAGHSVKQYAAGAPVATAAAADIAARQLLNLTENSAYAEPDEKYKVWPTNDDRSSFRAIMDAATPTDVPKDASSMHKAYWFFLNKMSEWLALPETSVDRSTALAAAIKDHIRLIVLDLEDSDEPQAIFETLNARGTPLLPADLIKNWLLWEGANQKLKVEELYNNYWKPFDRDREYWRQTVGTGHAARARVDSFLQSWLTGRMQEMVSASHLYDAFRRHVAPPESKPCELSDLMHDIEQNSMRFRTIDAALGTSRFATFLRRLKAMDLVVLHPLLMHLLGRAEQTAEDELDACAIVLESFLVRRLVCGAQTRGYGGLSLSLLKAVVDAPKGEPVSRSICSFLSNQSGSANEWPNDRQFESEWVRRRFYGQIRRERVVMILSALEEQLWQESKKTEPLKFDFSQLQIEHVMPQNWAEHWPLPQIEEAGARREALVHTIGNLTLLSSKLNIPISNSAWLQSNCSGQSKRDELKKHTKLWLNSQLVDDYDTWNEDAIEKRSHQLFQIACRVWPPPPHE